MAENQEQPLAQIYSDHWQEGGDDKLSFETEGLAKTLAQLAWNPANETPFAVDIRGDWGRGKTTLLRETQRLLNTTSPAGCRKVKTLWVNVWKYPSEDTVLAGILGKLLEKLTTDDFKEQLPALINGIKGKLAQKVLLMAFPGLADLADLKLSSMEPEPGVRDALERKRAFYDEFEPLFCKLAHLYLFKTDALKVTADKSCKLLWKEESKKGVVAIFLDDLDRCSDERVMQVLEAINLFLDIPGVCFFLGIHYERLQEILHQKLGDRASVFLEKIIQISLSLPEVSSIDSKEYLARLAGANSWLNQVINDDAEKIDKLLQSRYPRHIKRFLNDLSMRLALLHNTDNLGELSPKVPPKAVLAYHLFHETMPEKAINAAKLASNLDDFFRRWQSDKKAIKDGEKKELNLQEKHYHEQGLLDEYVKILQNLDAQQRETLLHLATPDSDEERSGTVTSSGLLDASYWVPVKQGSFMMGSSDFDNAKPNEVKINNPFQIAKYPITNSQYLEFIEESGHRPPRHWEKGNIPSGLENHPVVHVSWHDAITYCNWLTTKLGDKKEVRLPTEPEWEYVAAGGELQRKYPWGNEDPDPNRANFDNNVDHTSEVDGYPQGATPEGVYDMAGNVWEWILSKYLDYPYNEKEADTLEGDERRVVRGGSFYSNADFLRCAFRFRYPPDYRNYYVGFRVVLSPFSSSER